MVIAYAFVVQHQRVDHRGGKAFSPEFLSGKHVRDSAVSRIGADGCQRCQFSVMVSSQEMVGGMLQMAFNHPNSPIPTIFQCDCLHDIDIKVFDSLNLELFVWFYNALMVVQKVFVTGKFDVETMLLQRSRHFVQLICLQGTEYPRRNAFALIK